PQHRVLAVRGIAGEENAVDTDRGDRQVPEDADVDVHDVPTDRMAEEVDRAWTADRNDGKAAQCRADRDHRRQQVEKAVAAPGGAARFEEKVEAVRGRLQQSPGAAPVR